MNTPLLLTSALLAHVPHAFSTRVGGVSGGVFASLNLGNPSGLAGDARDPVANIRENLARITSAMGRGGREIVQVHQVHGAEVLTVRGGDPTHAHAGDTKADAIVSDDPARVLCVRVADCAPVLLADEAGRVVATVHAGWRGVIADVVTAAVNQMRALGAGPINAAVGPCIGPERFEVGPEVAAEFHRVFGSPGVVITGGPKERVDLKAALHEQLSRAGVAGIDVLPHCTVSEPELFFSHRRDQGLTGRTGAFIATRE
ncbi:MAG: peptidoglycan editing factor PgeF [Phycisphaerales bacterium]|nr:peptidoglycan editing factor PgeF [Phycisphaerales bacterium]